MDRTVALLATGTMEICILLSLIWYHFGVRPRNTSDYCTI